jgi:hypothetical protein
MPAIHWIDDDTGYEEWVSAHPEGFVANVHNPPRPNYFKIHRATHKLPDRSKPETVNPRTGNIYSKVTAQDISDLIAWAKAKLPRLKIGHANYCKDCKPANDAPVESKSTVNLQPAPEKHTPRAIDIENPSQPERVRQETYRILRDTALAREVKESHQYRCQICKQTLKLGDNTPYAEAHHIMPLGTPHNGPDVRSNILCVCPNDHVFLDYGAIKLDATRLEGIGKEFIDYHNEIIYGKTLV